MKKVLLTEKEYDIVSNVLNEGTTSIMSKEEVELWNSKCDKNFKIYTANELFKELRKICDCKTSIEEYVIRQSILYAMEEPYKYNKYFSYANLGDDYDNLFYINHEGGEEYMFTKVDEHFADFCRDELEKEDSNFLV